MVWYSVARFTEKLALPVVKVDLGCGIRNRKQPEAEWIHLDIQDIPGIDLVCDFATMPFSDKQVDMIHAADVIEHVAPYDIDKVLREWNRVLKVGGTFTGATPNLHSTMIRYAKNELSLKDAIGALYGSNEHVYQHHFITYTVDTLRELLEKYGFGEIDFSESPGSENPHGAWWIVWSCKKVKDL